jgi:hypothetical protein
MGLGGTLIATNRLPAGAAAAANYRRVRPPTVDIDEYNLPQNRHIRHVPVQRHHPYAGHAHVGDGAGNGNENGGGFMMGAGAFFMDHIRRIARGGDGAPETDNILHRLLNNVAFGQWGAVGGFGGAEPGAPLQPREPDYKPDYTHRGKPLFGFTFDFAPVAIEPGEQADPIVIDDDDVSMTGSSNPAVKKEEPKQPTLACANCEGSLLMDTGSMSDDALRKQKRVWSLRCGHMFDGRCISTMMQPAPEPEPEPEPELVPEPVMETKPVMAKKPIDRKGKGKAKAEPVEDEPIPQPIDRKGKGKAKAEPVDETIDELLLKDGDFTMSSNVKDESSSSMPGPAAAVSTTAETSRRRKRKAGDTFDGITLNASVDTGNLRSRLRSRPGATASTSSLMSIDTAPLPVPTTVTANATATTNAAASGNARRTKPLPKAKRKTKGKGSANVPETFEWECPVASCGRKHSSMKIDGGWVHDPKNGAIAMFV